MATFYVRTSTGTAAKGAGQKHAAYIAGEDKYSDKNEVKNVIDKNMPTWAKDGKDFFDNADKLERANGRSYRSLVIAIPTEAKDPAAWAKSFTDDLLKDKHAYRLAIHDSGNGNPHAHLMFCERGRNNEDKADDPKAYFTRKNPKLLPNSKAESKQWLENTKSLYLKHVQKVAPDYKWTKEKATGQLKVGPKLKNAGQKYEAGRQQRERLNNDIEYTKYSLDLLDKQEQQLKQPKKEAAKQPHEVRNEKPLIVKTGGIDQNTIEQKTAAQINKAVRELQNNSSKTISENERKSARSQQNSEQHNKQTDSWANRITQQAKQNEEKAAQAREQQYRELNQHSPSLARAFQDRDDAAPVINALKNDSTRDQFIAEQNAWQRAFDSQPNALDMSQTQRFKARADAALTIVEQLAIEAKTAPSAEQIRRNTPTMRPRF